MHMIQHTNNSCDRCRFVKCGPHIRQYGSSKCQNCRICLRIRQFRNYFCFICRILAGYLIVWFRSCLNHAAYHYSRTQKGFLALDEQESFFNQLFFRCCFSPRQKGGLHLRSMQFRPVVLVGFNQVIQNVLGDFCARDRFR